MAQRTAFLNSEASGYNKDFHHTWIHNYLLSQAGVMFSDYSTKPEFQLGDGVISGGKAIVKCTRTTTAFAGAEMLVLYESTGDVDVDVSGNKKVFIEIPEKYVNDSGEITDTVTQGLNLGVGVIKSEANYPSHSNYIPLWEITEGNREDAIDMRPEVLRSGKPNTISYFDGDGKEHSLKLDASSLNKFLKSNGAGVAPSWDELDEVVEVSNFKGMFFAGQDIKPKSMFYVEGALTANAANRYSDFGREVLNQKVSVNIISNGEEFDSIKLKIMKAGDPSDLVSVRIEGVDSELLPNGALVAPHATKSMALTETVSEVTIEFYDMISIPEGTVCAVVIGRTGVANVSNYYRIGISEEESGLWHLSEYNGTGWSYGGRKKVYVSSEGFFSSVSVQALASSKSLARVSGYSEYGATMGAYFSGIRGGMVGASGFKGGSVVYLGDDGKISAAPGLYSVPVGIAVDGETVDIKDILFISTEDSIDDAPGVFGASGKFLSEDTLLYGEGVSRGDSLFAEDMVSIGSANTEVLVGKSEGNQKVSIRCVGSGKPGNSISLNVAKVGALGKGLKVRIETDSSGKPSGILAFDGAEGVIPRDGISTTLEKKEVVLGESSENNENPENLSETDTKTDSYGVKIIAKGDVGVNYVEKHPSSDATMARIYNEEGTLLGFGSFVSDIATVSASLKDGETYYVVLDKDGSSYTNMMGTDSESIVSNKIEYTSGAVRGFMEDGYSTHSGGASGDRNRTMSVLFRVKERCLLRYAHFKTDSGVLTLSGPDGVMEVSSNSEFESVLEKGVTYNLSGYAKYVMEDTSGKFNVYGVLDYVSARFYWYEGSFNIEVDPIPDASEFRSNIVNINTANEVVVQKGDICHVVISQENEDVDSDRHYKLGVSNKNTTTRTLRVFDQERGDIEADKFPYVESSLLEGRLLSKTDAKYSYKTGAGDVARIVRESGIAGRKSNVACFGSVGMFDGLTPGSVYYVGDVPGTIGLTPGSNSRKIGKATSDDTLFLPNLPIL